MADENSPTGDAELMQTQAWICPACHDDHTRPYWLAAHDAELLARVQPRREEVATAIRDALNEYGPNRDDHYRAAEFVLALLPGRTEAEVRADERERVISLLIGPSANLDASVRAFKTGWHQADMEGRSGERVASGLRHVIEERIEKEVDRA